MVQPFLHMWVRVRMPTSSPPVPPPWPAARQSPSPSLSCLIPGQLGYPTSHVLLCVSLCVIPHAPARKLCARTPSCPWHPGPTPPPPPTRAYPEISWLVARTCGARGSQALDRAYTACCDRPNPLLQVGAAERMRCGCGRGVNDGLGAGRRSVDGRARALGCTPSFACHASGSDELPLLQLPPGCRIELVAPAVSARAGVLRSVLVLMLSSHAHMFACSLPALAVLTPGGLPCDAGRGAVDLLDQPVRAAAQPLGGRHARVGGPGSAGVAWDRALARC